MELENKTHFLISKSGELIWRKSKKIFIAKCKLTGIGFIKGPKIM